MGTSVIDRGRNDYFEMPVIFGRKRGGRDFNHRRSWLRSHTCAKYLCQMQFLDGCGGSCVESIDGT